MNKCTVQLYKTKTDVIEKADRGAIQPQVYRRFKMSNNLICPSSGEIKEGMG